MIKILFIIDTLRSGGKERQFVEHLKGLSKIPTVDFKVIILSRLIHYEAIYQLKIPIITLERKFKKDPRTFFKINSICKMFKPDLISSWESMCSFYSLPVAKWNGIKFINGIIRNASVKFKKYNSRWIIERLTFPFSNAIVANSKAGLRNYSLPSSKCFYVHNGFDFLRIPLRTDTNNIKEKYKIETTFAVGMIGGFDKRKDFHSFLKAALKILEQRTDVTFLAIGDGSNADDDIRKSTYETCKALVPPDLRNRILFPGRLKNIEEVIPILDIGILLTNQNFHAEGISNSILEYMAFGKPVIATNGGGTPEIVSDGLNGFLVPNGDISKVTEKINFLLDNPQMTKKMGRAGKATIERKFSLDKMTQNYLKLYNHILNRNEYNNV